MNKFKNGDFVIGNNTKMIVRLEREKDENGTIFCEWQDSESGDINGDWFNQDDLNQLSVIIN